MNKGWVLGIGLVMGLHHSAWAQEAVTIEVTLPAIEGPMYYRPYVAVWVENDQGEVVKNIALWSKEPDWLKDMRRWWRKTGRYGGADIDAVSGATRRPGSYSLSWDGMDAQGQSLSPGRYSVHVEAAREHGSRSWVQADIELGSGPKKYTIEPSEELGEIHIMTGVTP
ncbi:MAG: DUF2271 domain-containing protein [Nitrincola lacisaponensis]|uniref:DUF2271 domain-containing protein n=1 Tax=Nitrincola lacisaponensis TaxID=267850 RepID=UPI00391AAD4E